MLNAQEEINRLRNSLKFKGFSDEIVNDICNEASIEIGEATSEILADAMREAVDLGQEMKSVDFIEEIRAVRSGASFQIITDSGRTDYSEPPFPMLPKLLKNAKAAKDGSTYKVVAVEKSNVGESRRDMQVSKTIEAAYRNINDARRHAKVKRDAMKNSKNRITIDPMSIPTTMASMQALNKARRANANSIDNDRGSSKSVDFRVASSKQDPNTSWVNPGTSANVESPLNNINTRINENIDQAIDNIIRRYEDMY